MRKRWIVGDIHGCLDELLSLLDKIDFSDSDELYLLGDLINRGPNSIGVLKLLTSLKNVDTVLGNHDLAFLAHWCRAMHNDQAQDDFSHIANHPDAVKWVAWLSERPFLLRKDKVILTHAGLYPYWSLKEHESIAQTLHELFKTNLQSALTELWPLGKTTYADCQPLDKTSLAFGMNIFTRMRFLEGAQLCPLRKGHPSLYPEVQPWYSLYPYNSLEAGQTIVFGHWASLEGLQPHPQCINLDTGCVWGGKLTAMNLDDLNQRYEVISHQPWQRFE